MSNGNKDRTEVFTSKHAATRPAWTSTDLQAFNHRHLNLRGGHVIQQNYYKNRKGIA